MAIFSKPVSMPYTCYEIGHTWTPYCRQAAWDVGFSAWRHAFKIYAAIYVLAALVRRKGIKYWKYELIREVLQSMLFLGLNGYCFMAFVCIWSKCFGLEYTYATFFIPSSIASFVAILVERDIRRPPLAGYVANVAIETVYRMLRFRGYVRDIAYFEVVLFSVIASVYMYLLRIPGGLSKSASNFISFVVGTSECGDSHFIDTASKRSTYLEHVPRLESLVDSITKMCRQWVDCLPTSLLCKHCLCPHKTSCLTYVAKGFGRMFSIGYLIQTVVSMAKAVTKSKISLATTLLDPNSLKCATFLGSFSAIFRLVNCFLRWVRLEDSPLHGAVAGALAGLSMAFYRSSAIAMYLTIKLVEILYTKGIRGGYLPSIPYIDVIIYALSTGIVFHTGMLEPHNLRPAYWNFLDTVTEKRNRVMNRKLLDQYGTHASTLLPDFWPNYDPRFTSLRSRTS